MERLRSSESLPAYSYSFVEHSYGTPILSTTKMIYKEKQEKYFKSLIPNVHFFPCKYFLLSEIYTSTTQIMKYLMSNSNKTLFI